MMILIIMKITITRYYFINFLKKYKW